MCMEIMQNETTIVLWNIMNIYIVIQNALYNIYFLWYSEKYSSSWLLLIMSDAACCLINSMPPLCVVISDIKHAEGGFFTKRTCAL